VHGGPDFDHEYLLPEMDRLASSCHLFLYDQRGRGRSFDGTAPELVSMAAEVADLEQIRLAGGLDAMAIVGHSWGGLVALEYTLAHPDRVTNLVDEGFDMAIRIGRPADSSLVARKLCDVRIVVVGAPAYFDRMGEPAAPDELAGHDCIVDTNFREPDRWPLRSLTGETLAVRVGGRIRYSNAEACLRAAEAGLGLACVPSFVAGASLRAGRVRRILQGFETTPFVVHALYPHSRHLAAKVRALVDFLGDRYRGTPHGEQGWEPSLP